VATQWKCAFGCGLLRLFPEGQGRARCAGRPRMGGGNPHPGRDTGGRHGGACLSSAGYASGLLALREGSLLEKALRGLPMLPEVLLVNATGRDHPRRAGLALHLGARLDVPTVGVTDRPLLAVGPAPADEAGARSPLRIADELVGYWVRTKRGVRPLAVHAGWRTDPETGVSIVLSVTGRSRTPTPLREARRAAREARAGRHPSAPADVRILI
jgi:deoxyribonuclease V